MNMTIYVYIFHLLVHEFVNPSGRNLDSRNVVGCALVVIFVCPIESRFELICVIFLDSPWWEAWIVGATRAVRRMSSGKIPHNWQNPNLFTKNKYVYTPKFDIASEKWWLDDYFPIGEGNFSGAMLNFGRVFKQQHETRIPTVDGRNPAPPGM